MSTNETRLHDWRIQLMITDDYDRCLQRKLPSIPSHEQKLYHPDGFRQWPMPRYTSYECGTGWQVGCIMISGMEIRRNWGPRLGSRGNRSIEFRNSGLEESYQLGVPFFCFSLLFSFPYYITWISAQYKWRRHGFLPLPDHSQVEVEFPRALDRLKGYCKVPIGSGTIELVRVRTRHDWLMLFCGFRFSCMAYAAQEVYA